MKIINVINFNRYFFSSAVIIQQFIDYLLSACEGLFQLKFVKMNGMKKKLPNRVSVLLDCDFKLWCSPPYLLYFCISCIFFWKLNFFIYRIWGKTCKSSSSFLSLIIILYFHIKHQNLESLSIRFSEQEPTSEHCSSKFFYTCYVLNILTVFILNLSMLRIVKKVAEPSQYCQSLFCWCSDEIGVDVKKNQESLFK